MIVSSSISRASRSLRPRPVFSPLLIAARSRAAGPVRAGAASNGFGGDRSPDRRFARRPRSHNNPASSTAAAARSRWSSDNRAPWGRRRLRRRSVGRRDRRPSAGGPGGGVEEARPDSQVISLLESAHPVVDGLTADVQQLGDLLDTGPLGQPEQRLGATSLLGRWGMADDLFQFVAQPVTERE